MAQQPQTNDEAGKPGVGQYPSERPAAAGVTIGQVGHHTQPGELPIAIGDAGDISIGDIDAA
jgi:hypothetical protein